MLINFSRKLGPTIEGKKSLLKLDRPEREIILRDIKKEWKKLIDLHFEAESGITLRGKLAWQPLTDDYEVRKHESGLLPGILESSTPTLAQRYKKSIHYNSKNFSIKIDFPKLVTGPSRPSSGYADAGVHQLGHIKRPLVMAGFNKIAKDKIIQYLKK